jgi:REP element-mobilizing transposase RayT
VGGASVPRPTSKSKAHSENLRLNRTVDIPATFFVTKSLQPKKPALNQETREIVVSAFEFALSKDRIYIRSFVVMPDHWHALFAIRESWTLPRFMQAFMSFVAAKTAAHLIKHESQWQDGYYDTRIKTAKQFEYVTHYIEQNPVAKGLVEKSEDWEASSASRPDLVTTPWPWFLD